MKFKLSPPGRLRFLVATTVLCGLCPSRAPAQTYSVNAVGYVDRDLIAGYNLVANPVNAGDHSISNLFRDMPDGSLFVPWEKSLQAFGATNRFVAGVGWVPGTAQLPGGDGAFLWVPGPTRVTFVGEPWWYSRSSCTTFPVGATISSIWPLLSCGLCVGFTDPCPIDPPDGLAVARWDPVGQRFLDSDLYLSGFGWLPEEPRLAPGEAALFQSLTPFMARAPSPAGTAPPVRLVKPWRTGTNFGFQFWAEASVNHCLRRSTDLNSNRWETVLTELGPPGGGWVTVTDPVATNATCFYRLDCLRLLNPSRNGTTFSFQFHAEDGVSYQVSRKSSLTDPAWIHLLTIPAPPGAGLVTATDLTATNAIGYYRLEY